MKELERLFSKPPVPSPRPKSPFHQKPVLSPRPRKLAHSPINRSSKAMKKKIEEKK